MNNCLGCGSKLQSIDSSKEGYIRENNISSKLCERCFRIRNYGEYKTVVKDNNDFEPILKKIGTTNSLVILVIDLFMMNKDFDVLTKNLNNDILLVFTKRDVLPKIVNDQKFIEYAKNLGIDYKDIVITSSNKNYGLDLLMEKINQYKKDKNVYVIGYTNAGKSTLINKIIYNYSNLDRTITTSILPSTTINSVEININDNLTLIDTPGLIDNNSLINIVDVRMLKRILPNKEIKPITYQIKSKQTIFVDELVRIDLNDKNNLVFYLSNSLNIKRVFKNNNKLKNLKENIIRVKQDEDIVISGLGFIKVTNNDVIKIYAPEEIDIYTRKKLI